MSRPYHRHGPAKPWTCQYEHVDAHGQADTSRSHAEIRLDESPGGRYIVLGINHLHLVNGTELILLPAGARKVGAILDAYADEIERIS